MSGQIIHTTHASIHDPIFEKKPSEVIYQVYPSSFNDANGDGIGDLKGITEKLDYIQSLGVDAVWISPFFLSPPGQKGDGGYAVSNYHEIDPRFGTMADFDQLLEEAHARGIRIYTDFVMPHTSDEHPWFQASAASKDASNPYADFYIWHDGKRDEQGRLVNDRGEPLPLDEHGRILNGERPALPNNWLSLFGGPAWEWNETRQQYYLHHFLPSQPATNVMYGQVRAALLAEMKFWLDKGVDGFRLDALPHAGCHPEFHDDILRPELNGNPPATPEWGDYYLLHSFCQNHVFDLVREVRQLLDHYPGAQALGEILSGRDGGRNSLPLATQFVGPGMLDICYTNALLFTQYEDAQALRDMIVNAESSFPTDGGNCNTAGSHDVPRFASRMTANIAEEHRERATRQLLEIFMALPGSVTLYNGDELGMTQARVPEDIAIEQLRDAVAFTRGIEFGRDGCRTPLPAKAHAKNAGFSDSEKPYLPVPEAHYNLAVDRQELDPNSMLNFTRNLLAWRAEQSAFINGQTTVIDNQGSPVLAFLRRNHEQSLLCLFNTSDQPQAFRPSDYMDEGLLEQVGMKKGDVVVIEPYGSHYLGSTRELAAAKGANRNEVA
ncbi:MAG: alpha-glucosidase [Alphaproteobacteria bacterium]|nr:alpha-glucosidase [Alphaproteobacteria bacterium]